MSDDLLETRSRPVSSKEFGGAPLTERQFRLLNHPPAELL
jgi:hypothetical protein